MTASTSIVTHVYLTGTFLDGYATIRVVTGGVASTTMGTAAMESFALGPSNGGGMVPMEIHPHGDSEGIAYMKPSSAIRLVAPPQPELTPLDMLTGGAAVFGVAAGLKLRQRAGSGTVSLLQRRP
jgi:hypothetical protein